ncbi:hypothetical protein E5D57_006952 [Metarhizium anisopliae]|nr:hypothetical protein E5D57_006952 [Metarhizium anisopliae]
MSSKPHTEEPANDGQSLKRAGQRLSNFNQKFGLAVTEWPLRHRAQVKGWKPAWTEPFWTDTRTAYLTEVVSTSKTWDEVLARFAEKFQANKSAPAIRSRVKKLGLNIDHLRTHQLFTKAEKDYFDELAESGFKGKKMYERFWERFGKRITAVSLTRRLSARMKRKKKKQTPHCEYQTADGLRKKPVLCRNVWIAVCGKPKSYPILDGSLEMVDLTGQSVLRGAGW